MHNAAFRAQQMNALYGAYDVEPSQLKAALDGLRALGFLGVNVTIPHKEAVMEHLDEIAPTARQMGAVNTIVNRGGRLMGYNTDGWGFISSLEEHRIRVTGVHAMILGAGGAARAIALHLGMAGVRRISVSNRTVSRAESLVTDVRATLPDLKIDAVEALSPEERNALMDAGLVVNCTPLGMHPDEVSSPIREINLLPQGAVVYDTVYRPMETRLLREARIRGLHTVSGLSMLVHQGACAWEYWFGRRGPVGLMHSAALAALEGKL